MGAAPEWVTQGWDMIWDMLGRCAGSLASMANSSCASAGDTAAFRGIRSGASLISSYSPIIDSARNGSTPACAAAALFRTLARFVSTSHENYQHADNQCRNWHATGARFKEPLTVTSTLDKCLG